MKDTHGITTVDSHAHLGGNSFINLKAEEASRGGGRRGTHAISTGSVLKIHISE